MQSENFREEAGAMPPGAPFRKVRRASERIHLLGGEMDFVRPEEVFHFVKEQRRRVKKTVIANHNLHSLALMRKSPAVRAFFDRADLIEVDSVPAIRWARLLGYPVRGFHRCTYLDWREDFWRIAVEEGWRVFYLGCRPKDIDLAIAAVLKRHPLAQLKGRHGHFDVNSGSTDNKTVLEEIAAYRPDILMVGMGMPRQEVWVLENLEALPLCAVFTVGGAFDYEAGAQVPAPRWVARLGLEWLFRLASNPGRMFKRYCVEPFELLPTLPVDIQRSLARKSARI